MARTILVISDLHISAGPLDDCDDELQGHLCDFLAERSTAADAYELVINGDFLDFVQAPPWEGPELSAKSDFGNPLCFTQQQSVAKLGAIAQRHGTVFNALGDFLRANIANSLVIIPGNHDPDFFWPEVRSSFVSLVEDRHGELKDRIRFHLEQVYRPPDAPRVWIEHGNQHDSINRFAIGDSPFWSQKFPPIRPGEDGTERLLECVGTRFLNKYLNRLDKSYPFVDNVKPFGRFWGIFGASAFVPGHGPLKVVSAMWGMLNYLAHTTVRTPRDLLGMKTVEGCGPLAVLKDLFENRMSDADRQQFAQALYDRGFALDRPLAMYLALDRGPDQILDFLAEHPDLAEAGGDQLPSSNLEIGSGAPGTLALGGGYSADETRDLKNAARSALGSHDIDLVIMGHTHEVVPYSDRLPYINTGCWTRYYRFRDDEPTRPWHLLRSPGSFELFPYQLNYVEIVPERRPSAARMICYRKRPSDDR
jgi:UDP-2,3-diacylglucosamine pyrophosphatase LpxH